MPKICQRKAKVVILVSDKVDLKAKKITRDKERHYTMTKGQSTPARGHGHHNCICITLLLSCKIYETKTERTDGKNERIHNFNQRLQQSFLNYN